MTCRSVLLLLAGHVLTAGPAAAQPREVVVGLLYPLSGPTASAGVDEKHVYELFADMVNGKEPMLPGPFSQRYRTRSGKDLYDLPARAFTGIVTLVDAVNRAGATNPEPIRKALAATDLKPESLIMPWAGVRAIIMQLQAGKYHTVWPFEMATRDVIHPIPKWSERR